MANDVKVPVNFTYSKTAEGREKQLASLDAMLKNKDLNITQKALLKKRVKQLNQMNKGQALWDKTKNAQKKKEEQKQVKKRDEDKVKQSKVSEEERKKREAQVKRHNATVQRGKKKVNNPFAKSPTKPKTTRKTTGSGAAAVVPPKKKAYVPASKKSKQGDIGRTTTKYDTKKGKAKVAAKPKETKRKVGQSGMGFRSYQNLNFKRRK